MPVAVSPLSVPRRLSWPSVDTANAPASWQPYVSGLQLLGGLLSMPRRVEYQQAESDLLRQQLQGTGVPEEQIAAATPDAAMKWLSPAEHPGIGGTILGGVGDVGALLSTIAGQPISPPRASITELAGAAKLRSEYQRQKQQDALSAAMAKGPQEGESEAQFERRVAGMGVAGGSADQALRLFGRSFESTPWRGTPGERTTQTLDAQRAERAGRRASMLEAGYDPKTVDFWVETGGMPPQGRQTPAEQVQKENLSHWQHLENRKADATSKGLTGQPWSDYVYGAPEQRQTAKEKPATWQSILNEEFKVMQAKSATGRIDPDEAKRRAYARAKANVDSGIPVPGFDPTDVPLPRPAPTGTTAGSAIGSALGGSPPPPDATPPTSTPPTTSTPTSTTTPPGQTPATGLLPGWEFLDEIHPETLSTVGKVQAEQLLAQYGQMPVDAARNWATAIKAMTKK